MGANILSKIAKEPESRTTCTLSQEGSSALDSLMKDFGLTQKQVFELFINQNVLNNEVMNIAKASTGVHQQRQIRKSLVVTKRNLKLLNEASENAGLQRDVIIDIAFRWVAALLEKATELQKEKYKKALLALNNAWECLEQTERDLRDFLDDDDAILSRLSTVIVVFSNLVGAIESNIKNGTPIDADGM